ncbi:MAG TPA: hypothetical protein VIG29_04415 [Vicinamibacteria bacterium]|jgi:hypothetical protein
MPYRDPDPSDPNLLVGVSLPGDEETTREMAAAFAEEFALLGFDQERLMALFRRPHYEGAHRAYLLLGEEEIRCIVTEATSFFGRFRVVIHDGPEGRDQDLVQIEIGEPKCRR